MVRSIHPLCVSLAAVAVLAVGCGDKSNPNAPASPDSSSYGRVELPAPVPANFVGAIDNPRMPLVPGTTFTYEGTAAGTPETDVFFVTHQTKVIMGITCVEVHDQVFADGVLAEDTFDWFAQDVDGNVWYFGEDTKELDAQGNVTTTEGTWLAGENGAEPGVVMLAHPKRGDRYVQENSPGVAEDQARVVNLDEDVTVPYGTFDNVLLTRESTPLDRKSTENKYYAEGVGFIYGVAPKADEVTSLVSITTE